MPMSEQSIRVTAKGEFGQLQRGLKDLQGDLKNVLGEIDKGARKGGIFDDSNLHALDTFNKRFKDTLGDLDKQFQKQNKLIDQLSDSMRRANMVEKTEIQDQIKGREKELDVIRKQILETERLYKKRMDEANNYEINPLKGVGGGSSGTGSGSAFAMSAVTSGLSKIAGAVSTIGKFALGLAGIGSLMSMVQESYKTSYNRQVGSLDLAQRIRGYGFSGTAPDMYRQVAGIGRRDRMGYTEEESWALQNAYTGRGGALLPEQQYGLQKFARGYGLDATQVGSTIGGVKQLGGVVQPKQFADMIASSVSQSGMLPRIMEVMEAHTTLLQNINTTFKDGSSAQILAYQTTLDRLGNANGMTKLTGQQGASVISGLNGIYQPNNDQWQWIGISALQNYNKQKYGNMGLYDLQKNFEDGLQNSDNLPAMAQYLKQQAGGNNEVFKRLLQEWLRSGGYNATKTQVDQLDQVTGGFTAFNKDKIAKVMGTDSGAAYDANRKDEVGQGILDVQATLQKDLGDFGDKYILPAVTTLQADATHMLDTIMNNQDGLPGILKAIDGLSPLLKEILGGIVVMAGLNAASSIMSLGSGIGKIVKSAKGAKAAKTAATEAEEIAKDIPGATTKAGKEIGEVSIGSDIKAGALSASEEAELNKLSGGDSAVKSRLEKIYRSTGDMEAVQHAVSGNATAGDIIDMVSNGDAKVAEQLTEHYGKTGNIGSTIDKAAELTKGLGKGATAGAEEIASKAGIISKVAKVGDKALPIIGAGIDFGVNLLQGDNAGRAATRAGGSTLGAIGGGMGGSALGALIGGGIGALFGGVGAVPGAAIGGWLGGLGGGIGGGMIGDKYAGKAYDYLTSGDKKKQDDAMNGMKDFADKGKLQVTGLSTVGVQKLQEMSDKGLLKISSLDTSGTKSLGELSKEGKLKITDLSTEGSKQLKDLQSSGDVNLTSMATVTTDTMTKIGGIFGDIGDWFSKHIIGSDSGSSGGSGAPDFFKNGTGAGGAYVGKYDSWINDAAKQYGLDPNLIAGLIQTESGFNPNAYNPKSGATGLGQFLASTARDEGLTDRTDPKSSIYAIAKYLKKRIDWAGGDVNKGIMGYGEGTTAYLNKVLANYRAMSANSSKYVNTTAAPSVSSDSSSSSSGAPDFFGNGLGLHYNFAQQPLVSSTGSLNVDSIFGSTLPGSSSSGSSTSRVSVDVNLSGTGAAQLNTATHAQIKDLVAQAIEGYKNQQLAMNPTVRR